MSTKHKIVLLFKATGAATTDVADAMNRIRAIGFMLLQCCRKPFAFKVRMEK